MSRLERRLGALEQIREQARERAFVEVVTELAIERGLSVDRVLELLPQVRRRQQQLEDAGHSLEEIARIMAVEDGRDPDQAWANVQALIARFS